MFNKLQVEICTNQELSDNPFLLTITQSVRLIMVGTTGMNKLFDRICLSLSLFLPIVQKHMALALILCIVIYESSKLEENLVPNL